MPTQATPAPVQEAPSLDARVAAIQQALSTGKLTSLYFLLPLMFQLRRFPMTLRDHYMFEPMYRTVLPEKMLWKTGRQMGKSVNTICSDLLLALCTPLSTLELCPRFEQVRRLSNLNMRPLIQYSPVNQLLVNEACVKRENQRDLINGSVFHFSFALLDAERARGLSADRLNIDEIQDMNWDFLPLLQETLSGSVQWGLQRYAGTPKTFEHTIEKLWQESSGAELAVQCTACKHWNIGSLDEDLLKNIGPTTTVCSKCKKPINPRKAVYIHRHPERRASFPGYHCSQPYHPFFFDNPRKWRNLLAKFKSYPFAKFCNECLGESQDIASRLITSGDIKKACCSYDMSLPLAVRRRRNYRKVALGIDWGGGGLDSSSYTALVLLGEPPGADYLDLLYACRLNKNLTPVQECQYVREVFNMIQPTFVCHDFTGAGNIRESVLLQMGIPKSRIVPFTYVGPNERPVIYWKSASEAGVRASYEIDKARSLMVFCLMFKTGKIRFPRYEQIQHLTPDMLALVEERSEDRPGADVTYINKVAGASDDFAHALNYAASGIWHAEGRYPSLKEATAMLQQVQSLKEALAQDLQTEKEDA
jgi:hypothetical protein